MRSDMSAKGEPQAARSSLLAGAKAEKRVIESRAQKVARQKGKERCKWILSFLFRCLNNRQKLQRRQQTAPQVSC